MLTCIGNGGHARALELPDDTLFLSATPDDIRNGRAEIFGPVIVGLGFPSLDGGKVRADLISAMLEQEGCTFPSYSIEDGFELDDMGRQAFRRVHVGPGARVGRFCILNTGCIVEHDVEIGDFTHIAPGAIILGGARIGTGCLVGAGAVVLPGVVVPDGTLVKAGEVRKE